MDSEQKLLLGWGIVLGGMFAGNAACRDEILANVGESDIFNHVEDIVPLMFHARRAREEASVHLPPLKEKLSDLFGPIDQDGSLVAGVAKRMRYLAIKNYMETLVRSIEGSTSQRSPEEWVRWMLDSANAVAKKIGMNGKPHAQEQQSPPTV